MLPVLLARRRQLALGLSAAAVAMLAQILAPRVLMGAIDNALDDRTSSLTPVRRSRCRCSRSSAAG